MNAGSAAFPTKLLLPAQESESTALRSSCDAGARDHAAWPRFKTRLRPAFRRGHGLSNESPSSARTIHLRRRGRGTRNGSRYHPSHCRPHSPQRAPSRGNSQPVPRDCDSAVSRQCTTQTVLCRTRFGVGAWKCVRGSRGLLGGASQGQQALRSRPSTGHSPGRSEAAAPGAG